MRKRIIICAAMSMFVMWCQGQGYRFKFFLIPVFDHSVAGEVFTGKHISFQLAYQNHNVLGDNKYYHHRLIPSVRYYWLSDSRVADRIYLEMFHRSARIFHMPDQSNVSMYRYQTQSAGFSAGKQVVFRSNRMLMDLSMGRYFIYAGDAGRDFSDFSIFPIQERNRWRVDVKLGFDFSRLRAKDGIEKSPRMYSKNTKTKL